MNTILKIKGLKHNNLEISISENSISTISGANNCGKTTLMKILAKNIECESEIEYKGKKISEIDVDEYNNLVKIIIPKAIIFDENSIEEELYNKCNFSYKEKEQIINYLIKNLKIKKDINKNINTLTTKEIILAQIAIALVNKPSILLIDSIDLYFDLEEQKKIVEVLRNYIEKYGLTVIITSSNLEISIETDYLYIIDKGNLELEGKPLDVLKNDNIINKIGLNIPFMIDLSVKLKDYDLIDNIELEYDRMIEALWK